MSEEDLDCFPFIALQNVMKAFMITHAKCNSKELSVFRSLWDLYISYHMEVEFDDGEDFEKLVTIYFTHHNVKMDDAFDQQDDNCSEPLMTPMSLDSGPRPNQTVLLSDVSECREVDHL